MLQKINFEAQARDEDLESYEDEVDRSYLLRPGFYWELVKRRWILFVIPVVPILVVGLAIAALWPATYLSEGKILVQSQLIPTELVRPTVTNAAQERIQVIEQRVMTRENLLAIADKFQLFPTQRSLMSPTQLVDAVKKNVKIEPFEDPLAFKRVRSENPTIIFTVGFEYANPQAATQVANELVTRILSEDLRDRTSRATDTTQFLTKEVQRLQAENSAIEAKVAQAKLSQTSTANATADGPAGQLAQLRADYAQKSAFYSDRHPIMQAMKRQIAALQKVVGGAVGGCHRRAARSAADPARQHAEEFGNGFAEARSCAAGRDAGAKSAIGKARGHRAADHTAGTGQTQPAQNRRHHRRTRDRGGRGSRLPG